MSLLDEIRGAVASANTPEMLAVRFRHEGIFTKTQNGREREYPCRFSVRDPVKGSRDQIAAAEAFATSQSVAFRDVRELRVHPDHTRPPEGAVLTTPWDGGRLEVRSWSQPSDFTGQALALCVLRR
ncbi:hypothetical protein GO986_09015 [Deinococcus sp. HMF7620]|uniref:Uncharacterized protein n=1 Tax=Deinococcus arboris TaxID=2682977 RepID=A0A7C9MR57_9DEIO|nr:hypothetical protein [Deinococcus arboris]MVN86904.1 hypothetical protein [Deinococcus arboris]